MQNFRFILFFLLISSFLNPIKMVAAAEVASVSALSKININTANAENLSRAFKGIGPKRAEAIVHYREAHGAFKSVQELAQVKGIGRAFVERNQVELEKTFDIS
jgi:competence protein ComEA